MFDMSRFLILRQGKTPETEKFGDAGRAKSSIHLSFTVLQGRKMK
jgi:hypothetical protein